MSICNTKSFLHKQFETRLNPNIALGRPSPASCDTAPRPAWRRVLRLPPSDTKSVTNTQVLPSEGSILLAENSLELPPVPSQQHLRQQQTLCGKKKNDHLPSLKFIFQSTATPP